ncbi:MAG: hypothetical protein V4629_03100 [Pseudomonadota bacterium]
MSDLFQFLPPADGLLQKATAMDVVRAEEQKNIYDQQMQKEMEAQDLQDKYSSLVAHLNGLWSDAHQRKENNIKDELLVCMRQKKGKYSSSMESQIIKDGSTNIFVMLTDVKCRSMAAWLKDIFMNSGEMPFTIDPTPQPELNPITTYQMTMELQNIFMQNGWDMQSAGQAVLEASKERLKKEIFEEARKGADAMTQKIEDQIAESNFKNEFMLFIDDLSTYCAAFFEAPIIRNQKRLKFGKGSKPQVEDAQLVDFERISPFDVYPCDPRIADVNDVDLFVVKRVSLSDLRSMIGLEGVKEEAVRKIIEQYKNGGGSDWLNTNDSEREQLEGQDTSFWTSRGQVTALRFLGKLSGEMLIEYGITQRTDQISQAANQGDFEQAANDSIIPDEYYDAEVWFVGGDVFKCVLNQDPLNRKAIYKVNPFDSSTFWGNGISLPYLMRDCQDMVNVTARSCADNVAFAAGPQVGIDVAQIDPKEDITNIHPFKIWAFNTSESMAQQYSSLPLQFFQPQLYSSQLLEVMNHFSLLADEVTGIPKYQYGGDSKSGAAGTASGLSMLMDSAAKGLKQVALNIDVNLFEKMIWRLYHHNRMFEPDLHLSADLEVKVRGSSSLMQKETMRMRRAEFMDRSLNPMDSQIMGIPGRSYLLKETAKTLELDPDKIVQSPDAIDLAIQQKIQMEQDQQLALVQAKQGGLMPPQGQPMNDPNMQQLPQNQAQVV